MEQGDSLPAIWMRGILRQLLQSEKERLIRLARIEAAAYYVKGVSALRFSAIALVGLGCCAALLFLGLLLAHAAVFLALPWEPFAKILLLGGLGLLYIVIALTAMRIATSERRWMRRTGASRMVRESVISR
jgi:hypothetical protein